MIRYLKRIASFDLELRAKGWDEFAQQRRSDAKNKAISPKEKKNNEFFARHMYFKTKTYCSVECRKINHDSRVRSVSVKFNNSVNPCHAPWNPRVLQPVRFQWHNLYAHASLDARKWHSCHGIDNWVRNCCVRIKFQRHSFDLSSRCHLVQSTSM